MLLLAELQVAYDSAGFFRGVFLETIRRMFPERACWPATHVETANELETLPGSHPADSNFDSSAFDDAFFNELMDQGSTSSFWDLLGSCGWSG